MRAIKTQGIDSSHYKDRSDITSSMDIIETLNWRYAVKKFDDTKKISNDDWKILEESIRLAPSSFGLQAWKFWVVQDQATKEKLLPESWNQKQVTDCSHYVVFTTMDKVSEEYITKYVQFIADTRGSDVASLDGYKKMMTGFLSNKPTDETLAWTQRQSYIAMGQLMYVAAQMQIDSCPMEGISPAKYDEILGIQAPYRSVAAVALGYRHLDDKYQNEKKVRFPSNELFEYV